MVKENLSLVQLLGIVELAISEHFFDQTFVINAEISDVKIYYDKGFCFLKLIQKDKHTLIASADAVIWRNAFGEIKNFEKLTGKRFENGLELRLEVSVDYSVKFGLKINIHSIDTNYTIGEAARIKQLTLQKLLQNFPNEIFERDGLIYTPNKRLVLPSPMRKIALITGTESDALIDFRHELTQNEFGYQFYVNEMVCQVQGNGAKQQLITQLHKAEHAALQYDAIVLIRGGGSQVDFGPFDTYELAQKIAFCKVPVITGIGHERNVSLVDMMAGYHLKTPTKTASFIVEQNRMWEENMLRLGASIAQACQKRLDFFNKVISKQASTLHHVALQRTQYYTYRINTMQQSVAMLNPEETLQRGFAILEMDGEKLSAESQINRGDDLTVITKKQRLSVLVNEVQMRV